MTNDQALLRAILANPDDDGLRLVYADWLEEHGDPARAEFIRVQCELARLPGHDPRRYVLEQQQDDLLDDHQRRWEKTLPLWQRFVSRALPRWRREKFQRGFLHGIECSAPDWIDHGEELLRHSPIKAAIIDIEEDLEELIRCPSLAALEHYPVLS
jgi:uncharacterized protein (TIGR02996 family)